MKTRLIAMAMALMMTLGSGCVAMMVPMMAGMMGAMHGGDGGTGGHGGGGGGHGTTMGSESPPSDRVPVLGSYGGSGRQGTNQDSETRKQQSQVESGHVHAGTSPDGMNSPQSQQGDEEMMPMSPDQNNERR